MLTVVGYVSDGEGATFDGDSRITYDISGPNQYVQTRNDYIRLRFKTNQADGLLLFADGNQGDYIILEMIRGRLFVNLDLGQLPTTICRLPLRCCIDGYSCVSLLWMSDRHVWEYTLPLGKGSGGWLCPLFKKFQIIVVK